MAVNSLSVQATNSVRSVDYRDTIGRPLATGTIAAEGCSSLTIRWNLQLSEQVRMPERPGGHSTHPKQRGGTEGECILSEVPALRKRNVSSCDQVGDLLAGCERK
jgi:hypothetical protein